MSKGLSERKIMDMNKRSDAHYGEGNKALFPPDVAEDLKAAMEARKLSPAVAAEEIGIPPATVIQICDGGSPKGARKVKAKVKAWLARQQGEKGKE